MTIFILNDNNRGDLAGDVSIYSSLESVSLNSEVQDFEDGHLHLYDSEGNIYRFIRAKTNDSFIFEVTSSDLKQVVNVVEDFYTNIGLVYLSNSSLELNLRLLEIDSD